MARASFGQPIMPTPQMTEILRRWVPLTVCTSSTLRPRYRRVQSFGDLRARGRYENDEWCASALEYEDRQLSWVNGWLCARTQRKPSRGEERADTARLRGEREPFSRNAGRK